MNETTEATPADPKPLPLPEDRPPPLRRGVGFFTVLMTSLVVAALLGAMIATWPVWSPHVRPLTDVLNRYAPALFRESDAEQQIALLNERLAVLEKARIPNIVTPEMTTETEDLAAIKARIEALEGALSKLNTDLGGLRQQQATPTQTEQMSESSEAPSADVNVEALAATRRFFEQDEALRATLEDMSKRLTVLEASGPVVRHETGLRDPAGLLALGQLREALRGSAPFVVHLAVLSDMAGQDPALTPAFETLRRHAETGLPTLETLRLEFSEIAFDVIHAAGASEDEGWADRTAKQVLSVVRVRRRGADVLGEGVEAVVARIEDSLTNGDLAKAVGYAETLAGGPAETIAPWLTRARSRLDTEAALDRLQAHTVSSNVSEN